MVVMKIVKERLVGIAQEKMNPVEMCVYLFVVMGI
jgi:hypothetical protein